MYDYIYIIYIYRERERDNARFKHNIMCIYIYINIYIYIYDTSVDPKQQYISRLSKTCVYKAGHGVSSCSLWSMPSEHGASSWGIIMGHLYRFMGHHHLEHEHAQANAACNNATSNCSSQRPSHVVFHAGHYFGLFIGAT